MEKRLSPIVEASEVRQIMDNGEVVIADARGGADAFDRYKSGHLTNAIFMDLDRDLSQKAEDAAKGGRHPLPTPAVFGALLGRAGISPASHILVYDDKSGANVAARFWWMMRAAGHDKVQVVNGGLDTLIREGLPISTGSGAPVVPVEPYPITAWSLPVADIQTVERLRNDPDHILIDVREGYRYRGESEPIDLVAGHIPEAVNFPYLENLEKNGRFRSAKALKDQYRTLMGGRKGGQVVVHCGSGVTACHTLLALEIAGIRGASLYVGSWSEWSRNQKPVARGEKP